MYKSPIEIITTQLQTQILKQQENDVLRAVQKVGINVDKNELIKALQYDRDQYQKGYRDGIKDIAEKYTESFITVLNLDYLQAEKVRECKELLVKKMTGEQK